MSNILLSAANLDNFLAKDVIRAIESSSYISTYHRLSVQMEIVVMVR